MTGAPRRRFRSRRLTTVVILVVAGWCVGLWIMTQGFGGAVVFAGTMVLGPGLIGWFVPREPVTSALAFTVAVAAACVWSKITWSLDHGGTLSRELHEGWSTIVALVAWAIAAAFVAVPTAFVARAGVSRN